MVEFGVEGVWAYCCKRPRHKLGCERLHEELRKWQVLDQKNRIEAGKRLSPEVTTVQSSLSVCLKPIVTNTFITLSAESKVSNEAGILYSLMRKVVNLSTFSVFKVFLEYEVNLSQYNEALNVCSWVNEVIRLLGKLGGLNKGLELMNQKKRC